MKPSVRLELEGKTIELEDKLELELPHPNLPKAMCLPEEIERGKFYRFQIEGWKIFPFQTAILLYPKGSENPVASIEITEQTAFLLGRVYTRGEYYVRSS